MVTPLRAACLSLLIVVAAGSAGCVAVAAAGAAGATVAYVRGNTEGLLEATPEQIIAATNEAFEQMHITVSGSGASSTGSESGDRWQIKGKGDLGESVKVTIKQVAPQVCKVWVRVGMFGDEQYSRTVFERIRAQL